MGMGAMGMRMLEHRVSFPSIAVLLGGAIGKSLEVCSKHMAKTALWTKALQDL